MNSTTRSEPCLRCGQTGQFITYVENGVLKGPGGPCYRCAGKGFQTDEDRKRNECYDNGGYYQDRTGDHRHFSEGGAA